MSKPRIECDRRGFLRTTASVTAAVAATIAANPSPSVAAIEDGGAPSATNRRIFKAVKWDMIAIDGSLREKFELQKELGFDGMELISPSDLDPREVRAASDATGMPVHGVVDMRHWNVRLSSPDPAERDAGVEVLQQAIRDAQAFGGFSVLLVPGKVTGSDENHDHVWQRSIVEIRKVLPLASRLGVRVLIENVWNGFCDTPDQMRDYLDEIGDPWVGAYCDLGNCRKFCPSEHWIRTLGGRIVKLDCKDWGDTEGFCKIGEGDVDWPAVRQALEEVGFSGWCTAEVEGGGREVLADISARMDRVLNLCAG